MKIRRFWKIFVVFFTAVLLFPCFVTSALAYETVDTSQESSLTVSFIENGTGFAGVKFQLYRVADISAEGNLALTEEFEAYPVSMTNLDSSGWRALAQTLDAYISRDGLLPLKTAGTDDNGQAVFDHLPIGLYLVKGSNCERDGSMYTPEPFLVSLPNKDQESGEWVYHVVSSCKYDCDDQSSDENTVNRKIFKVWEDDKNEEKRPEEITIQLLGDGAVYDTVVLSKSNNWRYEWKELDGNKSWQVVEYETPENYTVSVSREGTAFVMTNTYHPDASLKQDTSDQPLLPQTGILWWPVPLLVFTGMILYLIGWGKRIHEEK